MCLCMHTYIVHIPVLGDRKSVFPVRHVRMSSVPLTANVANSMLLYS
jgi:hypothetical protein